jgi:hypothetical protein
MYKDLGLCFAVQGVLAAKLAVLLYLKLPGLILLVFGYRIIAVLALFTRQQYYITHRSNLSPGKMIKAH